MSKRNLGALYLAHGEELKMFLNRRVRCPHTVADLLQETFLRLAQQPPDTGEEIPRSYLFKTAKNLAIDHYRKQVRRDTIPTSHEVLASTPDEAPNTLQRTEDRERLEDLFRTMSELPLRTQQIFRLNRIDGMTYVEVAHRLGISESTVQKHLARAVAHAMAWAKSRDTD